MSLYSFPDSYKIWNHSIHQNKSSEIDIIVKQEIDDFK